MLTLQNGKIVDDDFVVWGQFDNNDNDSDYDYIEVKRRPKASQKVPPHNTFDGGIPSLITCCVKVIKQHEKLSKNT